MATIVYLDDRGNVRREDFDGVHMNCSAFSHCKSCGVQVLPEYLLKLPGEFHKTLCSDCYRKESVENTNTWLLKPRR